MFVNNSYKQLATTQTQLSESQDQARGLQTEARDLKQEMARAVDQQKRTVDELACELEQSTKESDVALAKASRQIRLKDERLKTADDEAQDLQLQVGALTRATPQVQLSADVNSARHCRLLA